MDTKLIYEDETYAIRGAVFEVYKTLGDGYLEDVYQNALDEELKQRGIPFVAQEELHIMYKGRDCGLYRPDFICFGNLIFFTTESTKVHGTLRRGLFAV